MIGDGDDVTLPKATVQKIISEVSDSDSMFNRDAREIIIKSGIEFIMISSSMASEMAESDAKKTIAPEHVIKALKESEYNEFIPLSEQISIEFKGTQKIKEKKNSKFKKSGLTEEELLQQQEESFRKSRSRLHQNSVSGSATDST